MTTNNSANSATPTTSTTISVSPAAPVVKNDRFTILTKVIWPAIKGDLVKNGISSARADEEIKKALALHSTDEGGAIMIAQAIVDASNKILVEKLTTTVQNLVVRARKQHLRAKNCGVGKSILDACNETLSEVEFGFAPDVDFSQSEKVKQLNLWLEKVLKVGDALYAEANLKEQEEEDNLSDLQKTEMAAAKAAAQKIADEKREQLAKEMAKLFDEDVVPAKKEMSRRQQQLYGSSKK